MKVAGRERADLRWLVLLPPALLLILWLARTMAFGGKSRYALIGLAVFVVVARPIKIFLGRRMDPGAIAIEIPVLLLLVSTLVWRERSAGELAANPLDSAGLVRVTCIAIAMLLGGLALMSPARPGVTPRHRLTTLPFRLYLCYIGVVIVGTPGSVKPFLTSYRAVELIAGCVVLLGAYQAFGNAAARRIEATIYWFTVALVASVWVGRFIDPAAALQRPLNTAVPLKWELTGVFPVQAANTVGALGALLAIWSLARYMNPRQYRGRRSGRVRSDLGRARHDYRRAVPHGLCRIRRRLPRDLLVPQASPVRSSVGHCDLHTVVVAFIDRSRGAIRATRADDPRGAGTLRSHRLLVRTRYRCGRSRRSSAAASGPPPATKSWRHSDSTTRRRCTPRGSRRWLERASSALPCSRSVC